MQRTEGWGLDLNQRSPAYEADEDSTPLPQRLLSFQTRKASVQRCNCLLRVAFLVRVKFYASGHLLLSPVAEIPQKLSHAVGKFIFYLEGQANSCC